MFEDVYINVGEPENYDLDSEYADDFDSPYDYGDFTDDVLNAGMVFNEGTIFDDR